MDKETIRAADLNDVTAIAQINNKAWRHAYAGIFPNEILDKISLDSAIKGWSKLLKCKDRTILVLEIGKTVYGFIRYGQRKDAKTKTSAEIFQFYLDPQVMGMGFGAQLLQKVERNLRSHGIKTIIVKVVEKNRRARLFFEKFGFIQIGSAIKDTSVMSITTKVVFYRCDLKVSDDIAYLPLESLTLQSD